MAVKASVLLSSYFTSGVCKTSDSPERNVLIFVYIEIRASVKNKYIIVSVYITQAGNINNIMREYNIICLIGQNI